MAVWGHVTPMTTSGKPAPSSSQAAAPVHVSVFSIYLRANLADGGIVA